MYLLIIAVLLLGGALLIRSGVRSKHRLRPADSGDRRFLKPAARLGRAPEIYYGMLTDTPVVANTTEKVFDYPRGDNLWHRHLLPVRVSRISQQSA